MEDTDRPLPYGVLPSLVSDIRGIGIGVSHHHITGASPVDDIQAEGSHDRFLQQRMERAALPEATSGSATPSLYFTPSCSLPQAMSS